MRLWFTTVGAAAGFEADWGQDPRDQQLDVGPEAVLPGDFIPNNVVPMRPDVFTLQPIVQPGLDASRQASRLPEWPISLVLTGVVGALIVAVTTSFRLGATVLAAVMCLAAALRLVLPESTAGMLKSRSRFVDLALLSLFAVAMVAVAILVPAPS